GKGEGTMHQRRQFGHDVGQFPHVRPDQSLVAVAERKAGIGMNVDDDAVGPGSDSGAGKRQDEVTAAARVAGVDDDRQVGQPLGDRDRTDVEGVTSQLLESADTSLAKDYVEIAALGDV